MLIVKQNKLNSKYDENEQEPLQVIRIIDNSVPLSKFEKELFENTNNTKNPTPKTTVEESIERVDSIVSKYICNPNEEEDIRENECFKTLTENLQ